MYVGKMTALCYFVLFTAVNSLFLVLNNLKGLRKTVFAGLALYEVYQSLHTVTE